MKIISLLIIIIFFTLLGAIGLYSWQLKRELGLSLRKEDKTVISKFAIMGDTHNDLKMTTLALQRAKGVGVDYILHDGDWTNTGSLEELQTMKKLFVDSGIPFWGVAGDHDLWKSVGPDNYQAVFGKTYQSFDQKGVHQILLDTSSTASGLGQEQIKWLENDLKANPEKIIFVTMHLPLYSPGGNPLSNLTIWKKEGENETVKKEVTDQVIPMLAKAGVKAVFAGDQHLSSNYIEPTSHVKMYVIGAVTFERNLQTSRFSVVTVYSDGSFSVNEEVLQ